MENISQILNGYATEYEIPLTKEMCAQFELYADMLLDWNKRVNLTAITDPMEIVIKHFLDSLLLLKAIDIQAGASLIDVGTGAGFPGVPLKIARPDLRLTLLDSLNKRIVFLLELSAALGQKNEIVHGRAEEYGRNPEFRESFGFVTARGVAALPVLCEYCLPFVEIGGVFAALKGPDISIEAKAATDAIDKLGGKILEIRDFILPNDNSRTIVFIKKISQIPIKYPRISAKITKKPL